jgi:hypothetical protein
MFAFLVSFKRREQAGAVLEVLQREHPDDPRSLGARSIDLWKRRRKAEARETLARALVEPGAMVEICGNVLLANAADLFMAMQCKDMEGMADQAHELVHGIQENAHLVDALQKMIGGR